MNQLNNRLSYGLRKWHGNVILRHYGPKTVTYILNIKQAAEFLECSEQNVRTMMDVGLLPAFKTLVNEDIPAEQAKQGQLYFLKSDLVNALRVRMGVPTEGFNVENNVRDRNSH